MHLVSSFDKGPKIRYRASPIKRPKRSHSNAAGGSCTLRIPAVLFMPDTTLMHLKHVGYMHMIPLSMV
jgi:hypothetical protein